jgi:hypothetical protein
MFDPKLTNQRLEGLPNTLVTSGPSPTIYIPKNLRLERKEKKRKEKKLQKPCNKTS